MSGKGVSAEFALTLLSDKDAHGVYVSILPQEPKEPESSEVKVRVLAAALNRRDHWIRRGLYPMLSFPSVMCTHIKYKHFVFSAVS